MEGTNYLGKFKVENFPSPRQETLESAVTLSSIRKLEELIETYHSWRGRGIIPDKEITSKLEQLINQHCACVNAYIEMRNATEKVMKEDK